MAYITNYNMKRIFKELQRSEKTIYTDSKEAIYPEHDDFCQKFFNKLEKSELYGFQNSSESIFTTLKQFGNNNDCLILACKKGAENNVTIQNYTIFAK